MSATNTLKANLITDLLTITGIGDVLKEQVKPESVSVGTGGAIGIIATSGEGELDSMTDQAGVALQVYELQLLVRSDTDANTASDTLLDAVRDAVEVPGSAIGATATGGVLRVEQATVTDWAEVETAEHIAAGWFIRTCEVTVIYYYNRGSA